jgi:ADP-dependent NAD(P)H-hydrate dehydratase / NAD(P)H-hydrate epimerase
MSAYTAWTPDDARHSIAVPTVTDDKYSRGVLGMVTGSTRFPGAAVLGVEAALHTGLGMVRYLGPAEVGTLVLHRRPEIVLGAGRVQAWLLGSGIPADDRTAETTKQLKSALAQPVPVVLDAGGLDLVAEAIGPVVITPHHRELARLLEVTPEEVSSDPGAWASRAAEKLGVTVLLKGNFSYVAGVDGTRLMVPGAPAWLATAGTGDALCGILGALVATHAALAATDAAALARLAASACVLHALAAQRAGAGGPFTVLELAGAVSGIIASLLAR